jgi:adenylate kinase family enzyme
MGIQGSGKGTHAKMLAGDFDLEHIAVGDIFRRKEYVITVDSRPGKEQVQQAIRDRLELPPARLAATSSQAGAR